MCVLSDKVGEVGRPLRLGRGGGVKDRARGLLGFEGEGERAGDDASGGTRQFGVNTGVSSSDKGFGSSSFSSDDTRGVALSMRVTPFLTTVTLVLLASLVPLTAFVPVTAVAVFAGRVLKGPDVAGEGTELEASGWVGNLLVRGRFNFLSGS
jgi:hypothetical protein